MLEFTGSVVVLDEEFFAESGDILPSDLAYDASEDDVGDEISFLSDGEGGIAPAEY